MSTPDAALRRNLARRLDGYTTWIRGWLDDNPAAAGAFLAVGPHLGDDDVPAGEDPESWLLAYHGRLHDLIPANRAEHPGLPGGGYAMMGRGAVVAKLPLPLTLGAALELVETHAAEVVERVAVEICRTVDRLCPEVAEELLCRPELAVWWPWPSHRGERPGTVALGLISEHFREGDPLGGTVDDWPARVDPGEVVRWAAGRGAELDLLGRFADLPAPQLMDPEKRRVALQYRDNGAIWNLPGAGLAVLWLLWRRTSAGAAFRAWGLLRSVAGHGAGITDPEVQRAAHAVLEGEQGGGDAAAHDPEAAGKLAAEVQAALPDLLRAVEMDGAAPPADPERSEVGEDGKRRLWWDAALARYLEALGEHGRATAGSLLRKAAARWAEVVEPPIPDGAGFAPPFLGDLWRLWLPERAAVKGEDPGPPRALRSLALVLWRKRVRGAVQAEADLRARRALSVPALSRAISSAIMGGHFEAGRQLALPWDGSAAVEVLDERGGVVGTLPAVEASVFQALSLELGHAPAAAVRLVRWAVVKGWEQWRAGGAEPGTIYIEGGNAELCREAGIGRREELRSAAEWGQRLSLPLPDGTLGGLWTYRSWRGFGNRHGGQGRRWALRLDLARELLPGGGKDRNGCERFDGTDRFLIPWAGPDLEPPIPNRTRAGPLLVLQGAILEELRVRAEELVRYGGIRITDTRWHELFQRSGVTMARDLVLDAWTGPFLARTAGRWTLTDSDPRWSDYLDFIRRGGERSAAGREAGIKGARARAEKRHGVKR